MTTQLAKPFWESKSLEDMTPKEWESLCDGCGLCCLHKVEDVSHEQILYTGIACDLLNCQTCRCQDYENRHAKIEDCVKLTADTIYNLNWLPPSCAYRIVAEGKQLPMWHPLISGDVDGVHKEGVSAKNLAINEQEIPDIEAFLDQWIAEDHTPVLKHAAVLPTKPQRKP